MSSKNTSKNNFYKKRELTSQSASSDSVLDSAKKGLSPVVATSLLLVLAVVAVVTFQTWFQGYSSSLYIQSETQSGDLTTGVERIVGDNLYFKSTNDNIVITKIEVDGQDCNYEDTIESGISQIDISSCLDSTSSGAQEAVVYTNQGVYSENFIVTSQNEQTSISPNPSLSGFITVWNTSITGNSSSNQLRLPLREGGTYDFVVDWGDGNTDTITSWNQAETLHTYGEEGVYTVNITGILDGFGFVETSDDADKLLEIRQWDNVRLADNGYQFYGAENFQITATDAPDLRGIRSLKYAFLNADTLNSPLDNWDTSSVVDMSNMFRHASTFNESLNFDTSNVINMSRMFYGTTNFNHPLSFDTSSVTDMSYMFFTTTNFNQPLSFDTSSVTDMSHMFEFSGFNESLSFDTSSVTDMSSMLREAYNFDQPLSFDTSSVINMSWMLKEAYEFNQPLNFNTSNVKDMNSMFYIALEFNQDISSWDVSNVEDMYWMFSAAEAFNQNLSSWDVSSVTSCADFDSYADNWTEPKPNLNSSCLS